MGKVAIRACKTTYKIKMKQRQYKIHSNLLNKKQEHQRAYIQRPVEAKNLQLILSKLNVRKKIVTIR